MIDRILYIVFFAYLTLYPLIPKTLMNYKVGDMLLILFMLVFFVKSIHNKKEREIFVKRIKDLFVDPIVITMLLSIIIMVISSIYAANKPDCFWEAFRFFSYIIVYIAIKYEFGLKKYFSKYYLMLGLQSFIVYIYGIIQYFTKIGVTVETNGVYRMESTIGYPTALAAYTIVMIIPTIMFFVKTDHKKLKRLTAINILLGLINLVISWSRNGWLALVVGLFVLAIIYNIKFLYAIIAGGVLGVIVPFIRERLIQLTSSAINGGRIKLWKIALKMIKEHPILGIGQGNYVHRVDEYFAKYPELYEPGHEGFPTHNSYLKEWCEIGTIGVIVFFSTYVIMFNKLINANKKHKDQFLGLTTGVIAMFVAFMFINLFDNMMFTPKVMLMFIVCVSLCITIDRKDIR